MATGSVPELDQLQGYKHAVAGHAGTLCDGDGKLFIKPCMQKEIDFYQHVQREASDPDESKEKYRDLSDILPVFMGTLMLTDPTDQRISDAVTGVVSNSGTVMTDKEQISTALSEQVAKVAEAAAAAAQQQNKKGSGQGGGEKTELAGAGAAEQEWIPTNGGPIKTDRAIVLGNASYGFKKPNVLDVKLGVRLYADDAPVKKKVKMEKLSSETTHRSHGFRVSGMKVFRGSADPAQLDDEGFQVYDKDFGRLTVTEDNVAAEISKFVFNREAGIDRHLGRAVCRALATEVARVENVIRQHEFTMYSASLLIMFEGDGKALEKAIQYNNETVDAIEDAVAAAKRVDSGIVLDDEGDFVTAADSDDDDEAKPPRVYTVKLIDFAHVDWTPGKGPDQNLLKGVSSIRKVFEELASRGN
ncbi:inositol-polyphosphate multikinase [Geosmithia morbida]|uniref:Kinase n=1 Tax=Geosmithia morbida TaxID=1094350 RepID=A0A9P4YUF2_9HYPO|nr:inositol-polyphosphate multikinase [Geosmithia morbida]KAF4123000.1 inositol-polyphosphate multikinase [Geosmithia morbida]